MRGSFLLDAANVQIINIADLATKKCEEGIYACWLPVIHDLGGHTAPSIFYVVLDIPIFLC